MLTVGIGDEGAIQVARPLTEVDDELSNLLVQLAVVAGVGILLAAALGAIVATHGTQARCAGSRARPRR